MIIVLYVLPIFILQLPTMTRVAFANGRTMYNSLLAVMKCQSRQSRVVSIIVTFVLLVLYVGYDELWTPQLRGDGAVHHGQHISTSGASVTAPLTPHGKLMADSGVELFYMLPSTPSVAGVLIFFHGCNHGGQEFFYLPEDRIVAMAALNRGLVVVSPTSVDRSSGCWSDKDVIRISNAIPAFLSEVAVSLHLPRMGMGASSGGAFLFKVFKELEFKSMVSYVMGRGHEQSDLNDSEITIPATAYVHMPRDERTAAKVATHMAALDEAGIPCQEFKVQPHPFTLESCDQRLPELGDRRCHAFLKLVKQKFKGLWDDADGTVLQSAPAWKDAMQEYKLNDYSNTGSNNEKVNPGELSPVSYSGNSWMWASMAEEIAVAYGMHEMTAEHHDEVFDFLMANADIDLESKNKQETGK